MPTTCFHRVGDPGEKMRPGLCRALLWRHVSAAHLLSPLILRYACLYRPLGNHFFPATSLRIFGKCLLGPFPVAPLPSCCPKGTLVSSKQPAQSTQPHQQCHICRPTQPLQRRPGPNSSVHEGSGLDAYDKAIQVAGGFVQFNVFMNLYETVVQVMIYLSQSLRH